MVFSTFDVFPKFSERTGQLKTTSGGIITLIMFICISILITKEVSNSISNTGHFQSKVQVDTDPIEGPKKVYIKLDTVVDSPCDILHIDVLDDDGAPHLDIIENITRDRLDEKGLSIKASMEQNIRNKKKPLTITHPANYCGSCYGAKPGACCNSCQEVMNAFTSKGWSFFGADRIEQCVSEGVVSFGNEKCHIHGYIKIRRGSGRFHIGQGMNNRDNYKYHSHILKDVLISHSLNHTINSFEFYPQVPGFQSPLTGLKVQLPRQDNLWLVAYFLHIVPTRSYDLEGNVVDSYQYTTMYTHRRVTNTSKKGLPGIHFYYDFAPLMVVSTPILFSLRTFLIHIAGIIGGAFSFATIIDAFTFGALSTIEGHLDPSKCM